MAKTIESVRFGAVELSDEQLLELPRGLIGLPGSGWALLQPHPASVFLWLHSTENPALALPVVDPLLVLPDFALEIGGEERESIGLADVGEAQVYVTVTAAPEPTDTTLNLRAPLVVWERRGFQVINTAPGAELRAPLPVNVAATAGSSSR